MKNFTKNASLALLVILSLALSACSSSSKKDGEGASDDTLVTDDTDAMALELNGSSDESTAGPLKTIYFDYNSSSLTASGKQVLEENANYLKLTDAVAIQIEGHADERGGIQYNIALGERRAQSVKDYLTALGVDSDRVTTVSYGKDRPVAFGHDNEAWSRNRRANFVITAK